MPAVAPGTYLIASVDGHDVAAIGRSEHSPGWATYISVDDADASAAAVIVAGGTVISGRKTPARAIALRPAPQTWNLSHLHTPEPSVVRPFYAAGLRLGIRRTARATPWRSLRLVPAAGGPDSSGPSGRAGAAGAGELGRSRAHIPDPDSSAVARTAIMRRKAVSRWWFWVPSRSWGWWCAGSGWPTLRAGPRLR